MSGYFEGTTPDIGLGDHVIGSAEPAGDQIVLDAADMLGTIITSHGGVQVVTITAYCERDSLGDAEWWASQKLEALAISEAGEIGFEDSAGRQVALAGALFVRGSAIVHALTMAQMELEFIAPVASADPAFGSAPAEPGTYGGRTSDEDYEANSVSLGYGPVLQIAVDRQAQLRVVPRTLGSKAAGDPRGAVMALDITTDLVSDTDHWQVQMEDKWRSIGAAKMNVTGNGNTWSNCVLDSIRPEPTDVYATTLRYSFKREMS